MLTFPDFKQKQIIIIFGNEGQRIKIKNDNLLVINKESETLSQLTCYKILAIWIVGHSTISSGLLGKSKRFGFSIFLLSPVFKPLGCWGAITEGNTLLRSIQYQYNSLDIPKLLIKNKINNQVNLLKSIRNKSSDIKKNILTIQDQLSLIESKNKISELMGIEGYAAKLFFSTWFAKMDWKGRKPRTKINPINTLMDIGYTYLFNFIEGLLLLYGFDIYRGVYHQVFYQRKSLVCDLVEPFRCIIDHQLKIAYNLNQINESDFTYKNDQYLLSFGHAKPYTKFLIESILNHKEDIFLYIQQYYRRFIRNKTTDFPCFNFKAGKKTC